MTAWEPTTGDGWGGRPVARRIADAGARQRVVVTGEVVDARPGNLAWIGAQYFTVEDGTGRITIVFGGLLPIPGTTEGVRCTVEGTALADGQGIALWNPWYRIEL